MSVFDTFPLLAVSTPSIEVTPDWGQPLYFANSVGRLLAPASDYALLRMQAGPHPLDYVKAYFAHTSQLLRSRNWHKLLVDQRAGNCFTASELTWLEDYWLARQQREGRFLYGALVLSPDAFASLAYELREQAVHTPTLTYRYFEDQATAAAWLQQLN